MTVVIYVIGVVLFALAFALTRLPQSFSQVISTIREAIEVMTDPALTDNVKERAAQQAALRLLVQTATITLKGAAALTAAALPFWLADVLAFRPLEDTIEFALRWDVLTITALLMIIGWRIGNHRFAGND